jgi:hypothetical protein
VGTKGRPRLAVLSAGLGRKVLGTGESQLGDQAVRILGHARDQKGGGTGIKQRASNDTGCLFDGNAFLKALAVVNDKSFEKGGTKNSPASSSSPPLGILAKQSLRLRSTTIVDFWSPTRATSAGSGARLVLPRFATWCKKRGVPSAEIPRKRVASSPLRFSTGSAP